MFTLTSKNIEYKGLREHMQKDDCGGFVCFEGWVRNHHEGRQVQKLEYEAYAALAESEGNKIIQECKDKFGVENAICHHRVGALDIGGIAVWVGVSTPHRGEAFAACRFIIDEIKHRVPIWKKEFYTEGDSSWVRCEGCAQHSNKHHQH
jgi:molybdopterin synthase catalytic subunit